MNTDEPMTNLLLSQTIKAAVKEERERVLAIIEGMLLDVQTVFELGPVYRAIEKLRKGEL